MMKEMKSSEGESGGKVESRNVLRKRERVTESGEEKEMVALLGMGRRGWLAVGTVAKCEKRWLLAKSTRLRRELEMVGKA